VSPPGDIPVEERAGTSATCGRIGPFVSFPLPVRPLLPLLRPPIQRFRILFVEDDPAWQHLVATGLAEHGIDVHGAPGVARALESIDAVRPDAVVLDAILPDGNGFDLCRRVRALIGELPVPILVFSGRDDEASIERAFAAGAADFFVKSLQWKLLAERLAQLVSAAQMRTELASSQRRLDRAKGLALLAHETARRTRELSSIDPLTGLLNRKGFLSAAQALLDAPREDPAQPAALLRIDLDRFNRLNDTLGAAAGDEALKEVATRLRQAFRNLPRIVLARLASDEFALFFPEMRTAAAAERAAQIAMTELGRPLTCGGLDCVVRASVGLTTTAVPMRADALLAQAGQALSAAKSLGGNCSRRFQAELGHADRERFDLEAALHQALDRHELVLHYQPIIDPRSRLLSGVEALMRWQRDDRLLSPREFIPIAEETGLIFRMGEWAVAEALQQVRRWQAAGLQVATVSVNIHARHLEQPELARAVSQAFDSTGLAPSTLELELTETGVMRDIKRSLDSLQCLKQLGVRLALDDFGTGYSSLAYLTQLPIDTLKIDRSFVDKLGEGGQSRAVVRSITALAQALGLSTVAEGVETRAQLDSLRALGCDEVQGYFYARPMPAQELPGWTQRFDGAVPGAVCTGPGAALRAVPGVGETAPRIRPDDPVAELRL
jgi:diguanylate cyclase (GGDEF)-like protein